METYWNLDSEWQQLYDEPEDYEMTAAEELLGSEE